MVTVDEMRKVNVCTWLCGQHRQLLWLRIPVLNKTDGRTNATLRFAKPPFINYWTENENNTTNIAKNPKEKQFKSIFVSGKLVRVAFAPLSNSIANNSHKFCYADGKIISASNATIHCKKNISIHIHCSLVTLNLFGVGHSFLLGIRAVVMK